MNLNVSRNSWHFKLLDPNIQKILSRAEDGKISSCNYVVWVLRELLSRASNFVICATYWSLVLVVAALAFAMLIVAPLLTLYDIFISPGLLGKEAVSGGISILIGEALFTTSVLIGYLVARFIDWRRNRAFEQLLHREPKNKSFISLFWESKMNKICAPITFID